MIDSMDLRIGNVLKCNTIFASFNQANNTLINSDLITVKAIDDTKIGYINTKYGLVFSQIEKFEPIKLTPEILEQIGGKTKCGEMFKIGKITMLIRNGKIVPITDATHGYAWINGKLINIKIIYLHDLQNLYYYHNNKQELPIDINTLKI